MYVHTPIRVRYGETDMMGVVYHANYLLYMEEGREDFVGAAVMPYSEIEAAGYMCPIRSVDVSYFMPLRFGERGFVVTSAVECRPTRVTYQQRIYREGMNPETDRPLVSALVVACLVARATFKPVSFRRTLPKLYDRYLEIIEPIHKV